MSTSKRIRASKKPRRLLGEVRDLSAPRIESTPLGRGTKHQDVSKSEATAAAAVENKEEK